MATPDASADRPQTAGANPFVGPQSLETGQRIFGRDREIDELYFKLGAERIVLLHSPSGAGKSSLIRAGLMPRLQERFDLWGITRVNTAPAAASGANRYVRSAILGFEQDLPDRHRRADATLSAMTLTDYVAQRPRRLSAPKQVVLIFDQFEEILTIDPLALDVKREFFRQLGELLLDRDLWALFALREDYLAALDPYAQQMPTHLKNRFRLDLLGREAAQQAMVGTAALGGRAFPDDAVAQLAQDLATMQVQQPDGSFEKQVGPHVEPLHLQVACRGLWERMPADDLSIDLPDIANFGNVDRALANYYDDVVGALPGKQRDVREWVGGKLITTNGIRSQVLKGAGKSEGLDNALIAQLVDAHLVRAEQRAGAVWYELAHDRLVEPVRESNELWLDEHLSPLQKQAELWQAQGRAPGLLFTGDALTQAQAAEADATGLTQGEQQFLAASVERQSALDKERRQARRLAWLAASMAVVGIVALAAMTIALRARTEAERQRQEAEAQKSKVEVLYQQARAESLANTAESMARRSPDQSVLLALELNRSTPPVAKALGMIRAARAAYPYRLVLRGHEGPVTSAQLSPDGMTALTASSDKTARLWNVATGQLVHTLSGHGEQVISALFSPDGKTVLTASWDGTARLWEVASGRERLALSGHTQRVTSAQFSPDGKTVLTASDDKSARLWNVADGKQLPALSVHEEEVTSAQFSEDGNTVLTSSWNGPARLWDVVSGRRRNLNEYHGKTTSARFSADGKMVLTADWDQTARLWNVATGKVVHALKGHFGTVNSVQFSPDGKTVLTASDDATARLWDVASGALLRVLSGHEDAVTSAQFSTNGKIVLTASEDQTARLWDVATGRELRVLRGHESGVTSARFSRDGKTVLTAGRDQTARLWDVDGDGVGVRELDDDDDPNKWPTSTQFSADGKTLLTISDQSTEAHLWDVATGNKVRDLQVKGNESPFYGAQFSADGKTVLTASADHTARLWADDDFGRPIEDGDMFTVLQFSPGGETVLTAGGKTAHLRNVATDKLVVLTGHAGPVNSAKFSRDGKAVLTTSDDKTARLWDVATGKVARTFNGHEGAVTGAQFSPDGKWVLTASEDKTARLWDAAGGGEPRVLRGHAAAVTSAQFSADGKTVLTVCDDETARLWDVASGKELRALRGHTRAVTSAQFSTDGKTVLTASADATARLWDAASGKELRALRGHRAPVTSAQFSADGKSVLTASLDNTLRQWDCPECRPLEGLADEIARKVGRTLTQEERQRFGLLKN